MKNNIEYNIFAKIFIWLFFFFLIISCSKQEHSYIDISEIDNVDSAISEKNEIVEDKFPKINYKLFHISSKSVYDSIRNEYAHQKDNPYPHKILITLNRKEFGFIRIGDKIIVPDTIVNDLKAYSIFPQEYPGAKDIPKIIMVSNKYQCYGCYEFGKLVRFAAANTGKERTPTYPGRYGLVWKDRLRKSSLDSNWVLPFTWNFHAQAGSAFHKFVMPGRPVSHSCIRQFLTDAEWLYNWGEGIKKDSTGRWTQLSGTPVIIIDIFDFSRKSGGPWLELTSNKDSILQLPEKPMEVEEALIPIIQIPKESRGSLINRSRYLYAEDTLRARGVIRPNVKLTPSVNFNKLRRERAALKENNKNKLVQ
mgnify:CR=1 FL=1